MDKNLFDRLAQNILPEMNDEDARRALVESALYGSSVLQQMAWDGAARPFTVRLVCRLQDFGEIVPGKPALVALLEEIKGQVGADRQAQIDELVKQFIAPHAEQPITLPPKTFGESAL